MTQIQLTTREAVQIAISETAAQCGEFDATCVRCQAVRLLCDTYGFKLEQFFEKKSFKYYESAILNNPEKWVR